MWACLVMPVARMRASSTRIGRPGMVKPNSRSYCCVKLIRNPAGSALAREGKGSRVSAEGGRGDVIWLQSVPL
jgi:hypothetical protein